MLTIELLIKLYLKFLEKILQRKYYDGEALIVEDYFKNECQKQK